MDWVLKWQEENASRAGNPEDKKRQHRAYQDIVLELTKAYALASASDAAAATRAAAGAPAPGIPAPSE